MLTFQDIITNLQKYWIEKGYYFFNHMIWKWVLQHLIRYCLKILEKNFENMFRSSTDVMMEDMVKILIGSNIITSFKF